MKHYRINIDLVAVRGGCRRTPRLALRGGWLYGSQDAYTVYSRPYMLDYDWFNDTSARWQRYLSLLETWRPYMAVILDYTDPSQRSLMWSRVSETVARGVLPIVVPKFSGAAYDVPLSDNDMRIRIGVSVPTASDKYGGYLPTHAELSGRPLHLLGGHPDQWRYLQDYYTHSSVLSADGNVFIQQATTYGKFWRRSGGYREMRGRGFSDATLAIASMRNAHLYMHGSGQYSLSSTRVMRCRQALGEVEIQLPLFEVA